MLRARVLVLSIPDWGVTPFAGGRGAEIGPEIDRFNALKEEETRRAGARWVDVTACSRRARGEPALLAADGLHPSALMYQRWVALAHRSKGRFDQRPRCGASIRASRASRELILRRRPER